MGAHGWVVVIWLHSGDQLWEQYSILGMAVQSRCRECGGHGGGDDRSSKEGEFLPDIHPPTSCTVEHQWPLN